MVGRKNTIPRLQSPRRPPRGAICAVLLIVALLAGVATASADMRIQGELDTFTQLVWTGAELGLLGHTRGELDFLSPRRAAVQARLQLRATLGEQQTAAGVAAERSDLLEVPRASLRFRFPLSEDYSMRVTAGRDRLTWGIGSLFNAADLLFGADGTSAADFSATDDVRDETTWLASFYFPMGALSYLETVALPRLAEPQFSAGGDAGEGSAANGNDGTGAAPAADTRAGLRLHTRLAGVTIEPAYLYDGREGHHDLALALQGGWGADLYATVRLRLDADIPADPASVAGERSTLSGGIYYSFDVAADRTLTGRLETLVAPGASWENRSNPEAEYAILLYPELVYAPGRTVNLIGRSVVSPIDHSALITGGVSWNVFQGFRALAFAAVQVGDQRSVYGWDRPGSFALSTGFNYRF